MIIESLKEVQTGYKEIQQFSFDFRPVMFHKNLIRYFLLMRHVFIHTPALFSHKRKTCTNKFDFLLPPEPDGQLSVIYFFDSFKVFIQLETTRNCLKQGQKQGDMRSSYCSYQNQFRFYSRYVVFRNSVEVITYSYGRGNTSVYFSSPFFFSKIYFSSYTDMSECRPRR